MGNYNPHSPYILGQEWVPIRDENLAYSPVVNAVERGVTYVQAASQQVRDARFHLNTPQPTTQTKQCGLVNVYPADVEDQTGPIQQVLIPVRSGSTTGSGVAVSNAANIQEALYQPGDNKFLDYSYVVSPVLEAAEFYFAVNDYPVLANKRILNVSLAYSGSVIDQDANGDNIDYINPDPGTPTTVVSLIRTTSQFLYSSPASNQSNTGALSELATTVENAPNSPTAVQIIAYMDLGDVNNWWDPAVLPSATDDRMPWRYVDLQQYEPTSASRISVNLRVQLATSAGSPAVPLLRLDYLALRVIYCEEKRVAYGAKLFNYQYGMNKIALRDPSFNADPILPAGTYLPTLSFVSPGQVGFGQATNGDFPKLNALRELYQIPSHESVEVDIPFPLAERLGDTFTSKYSAILPQLSLHASGGGPLTEPHVYGRQVAAQVWGSQTAIQGIYDGAISAGTSFEQVRYYARRFGNTTIPLKLTATTSPNACLSLPGAVGSYASTPDDAALDITGDLDIRTDVTKTTWLPAAPEVFVAKWTEGTNNRSYLFFLNATGTLSLATSVNGIAVAFATTSTASVPVTTGRLAVRATVDVDNGAGGNTVTFYTSPTMGGVWTQLGTPVVNAGTTSIFSGAAIAEVGTHSVGTQAPLAGCVHAAQIQNGIDGTVVANPDFAAQTPGTGSFVDGAGRTWTINGAAVIIGGFAPAVTNSVSISVSDFDSLPEILDGWREVTLRFSSAPTMGASQVPPAWEWSAAGETAGNRWEILGAAAPAISGVPGSLYTRVPDQLGPATYQPNQGTTANLSWMPQGVASGWVTGTSADPASDAVLIFSQDPATITGVSISQLTQAVSGIGTLCGSLPCCIPSGIGYNALAWSANTLPSTGFGAYELQRYDSLAGDFETIMLATDQSVVSFVDFEARSGGVVSVYRIRALNALNFAGAWSAYVSGTGTAPGITGPGTCDMTGALIFTSNADQSGANNAAYVMQWENTPAETFDLFEADAVEYQPMYGRAGRVAFHGAERGLEEFSRVVLLQAGAIALPSLANAETIRDLAWADLPYVCARDGRGNRWFSNVRVPNVNVRNDAQNYLARLDIVETTRTPYPVDP